MKKFWRSCGFQFVILIVWLFTEDDVRAADSQYIGEMHPPVSIARDGKKIEIFFLRHNLAYKLGEHVGSGSVFYFQYEPVGKNLVYVWKVEGEEIVSVFFAPAHTPSKGESMYVLTKGSVSDLRYEGHVYSVTEYPIIAEGDDLSVNYFSGDVLERKLQYCLEGVDKVSGGVDICAYKNAASIKKFIRDRP